MTTDFIAPAAPLTPAQQAQTVHAGPSAPLPAEPLGERWGFDRPARNQVTDQATRTDVQPGVHVTVRHNGQPTRVYVMSTARQGATLIDFVGYHADFGPNRINDGRIFKPADLVGGAVPSDTAARNRVTDQATRTDADALRDTANHHQGSRVHAADADHGRQLRRAGLVGPRGGLTRRGSIVAERLRNDALDDAFGPL